MRISWNWLSEMVDLSKVNGPEGLASLLTERGLEVEDVLDESKGFDRVVTAQILERAKHPDSDRLSLCKVSIGSGDPLEIVCGAQNMKSGDKVALAQIGAHLPNGLKIAQSKIRGATSYGMLCSETELGLATESAGIMILPPDTPVGVPLAKVLGRDDTVLVLKLTANRGDCLSHFGIAREVAGALQVTARELPYLKLAESKLPMTILLRAGENAPQFMGVTVDGVKVGPSPLWLVKRLEGLGSRSINNVVDATNLVMLELGHPVHAYDRDLLEGDTIGVRMSQAGEKLPLLDGTEVILTGQELVIADGGTQLPRPIGLAGVMGGGNSEVRPESRLLFLECAEFAPSLIRKASARFSKKTDASHRFERGIDPAGLSRVMGRLSSLILELAGGQISGQESVRHASVQIARPLIVVDETYFNRFLGTDFTFAEIESVFSSIGCEYSRSGGSFRVHPPSFRLDLRIKEDLAEEIGRCLGYARIPGTVPPLSGAPQSLRSDPEMGRTILVDRAKDALVQAGFNESINLAFTSRSWLKHFGLTGGLPVVNPLSEEHEILAPSLLPGLARNALDQFRHHFGSEALSIRLFELRPTYHKSELPIAQSGEMETGAIETWKLAILMSGHRLLSGLRQDLGEIDFYDLKGTLEQLIESLAIKGVRMIPLSESRTGGNSLFHPGQSVEILAGNQVAGFAGLMHPGVSRQFKFRAPIFWAELDWTILSKTARKALESAKFKAWPEVPSMERDFALLVKDGITADRVTAWALKAGKPLLKSAKVFDVYRGRGVAEGMTSIAVRVIFYEEGRSLTEAEVEAACHPVLEVWKKELGATLR